MAASLPIEIPETKRPGSVTDDSRPCPPATKELGFARQIGDRLSAQQIALTGLIGFAGAWRLMARFGISDGSTILILFVLLTSVPMAACSVLFNRTHWRSTSGLLPRDQTINWSRCAIKILGLGATLSVLAIVYWLLPEYGKTFYHPLWRAVKLVAIPVLLLTVPYIVWVDRWMNDPEDGYWHTGLLFLVRWKAVDRAKLRDHAMGWLVKGFYLPLMLAGAVEHLSGLSQKGVDFSTFTTLYSTSLNLIYAVDVVFGAVGYLLTLRLLDSHIRSTEPTWLGWCSAICCYVPFAALIWQPSLLNYKGPVDWHVWLCGNPVVYVSWGFMIILLHVVYVWATCSFGCRFSNLTNRGIIVDGPYRYLKHPAYVAKNLAWWLMFVPMVGYATWTGVLRACACLAITNLIYAIRAWTEERHLMHDPAYVEYSVWMRQHSLLASCRRQLANLVRRLA